MQSFKDVGPIPVGFYTIGPAAPWHDQEYVMDLTPEEFTDLFGRSGFKMHGERKHGKPRFASTGCIILGKDIREIIAKSGDNRLWVSPGYY